MTTTSTEEPTTSGLSTPSTTTATPLQCPNPNFDFNGNDNFDVIGIRNSDIMWRQEGVVESCRRRITADVLDIVPTYDQNDVNPAFDLLDIKFFVQGATQVRIVFRKVGNVRSPAVTVSNQLQFWRHLVFFYGGFQLQL